jgi:predicted regulator of amino acid metabolism with ACT domain
MTSKMFERIMGKFADSPSQRAVVRCLLERGFSVNDDGRVVSGGIEIPNTGIAREVEVDRRVVDATTETILADAQLRRIFQNISAFPSLMSLAPVLDMTVLTISVVDEAKPGIVAEITAWLADREIPIRQIISEDPEFTEAPRLYIVVSDTIPGALITEIQEAPFVNSIEIQ